MAASALRPETEATLLLCGNFAGSRRGELVEPLNVREFNEVLWLLDRLSLGIADLLHRESLERLRSDPAGSALLDGRISELLDRGPGLAQAAERWTSAGLWVLDRTDPAYPGRYRQLLGDSAPPLLYGAGDPDVLNTGNRRIAIVGSRDIDQAAETFARGLGRLGVGAGAVIVSGGARGVDRIALDGALSAGGDAIAILPGGLEQVASSGAYRQVIADGRFTAVSPYHPRAKFSAGNAMGRNRLIYCLSDVGVVVESALRSGGTWAGATDALKHGRVPVFARQAEQPSPGNQALIDAGASPVPHDLIDDADRFAAWLETSLQQSPAETTQERESRQLGFFPEG